MERWIVKYSSGAESNAISMRQARNYAHCDKKATIHHLVEAREKVWVVRDAGGRFVSAHAKQPPVYVGDFVREEWLGGGA